MVVIRLRGGHLRVSARVLPARSARDVCDGESKGGGTLSRPLTPPRQKPPCYQQEFESVGTGVPSAAMEGTKTEEIKDGMPGEQQVLGLGIMLGQRRAFGMIAGRCSAAQAECLRKVREQKSYLKFAPSWGEFCERYLKICKRTADRAIAQLKKHGALYFETAALTGITPAEFERIEDAIQQDGIHVGSDVIALIPENAARQLMTDRQRPRKSRSTTWKNAACSCAPAFIKRRRSPIPSSASGSSARSRRCSR